MHFSTRLFFFGDFIHLFERERAHEQGDGRGGGRGGGGVCEGKPGRGWGRGGRIWGLKVEHSMGTKARNRSVTQKVPTITVSGISRVLVRDGIAPPAAIHTSP